MTRSTTVVVGASVAGVRVAQTLRRRGHDGPVILLEREPGNPYDKPALSKTVLVQDELPSALGTATELAEENIDFRAGTAVDGLDLVARQILIHGEEPVPFAQLVITTGSRPRRLSQFDGLRGVHYLRTRTDAAALRAAFIRGGRVVVIGGGFIGGEVAASARSLGLPVTIVEAAPRLLARLMPTEVSEVVAGLHRDHGVKVICGRTVTGYRGGSDIEAIELDDGTVLPAEIVVIGIGTVPDTAWLEGSGLRIDNGILCGPNLAAEATDGVFVAGDVARWHDPTTGFYDRAEHWTSARDQAAVVAHNLIADGPPKHFATDGYVWSDQFGVSIQHVGRTGPGLRTERRPTKVGRGQLFVHLSGGHVVGATTFDAPSDLLAVRRDLASR